jgi:hypothetical protein
MAAINGANLGLGVVTLGLETDFPEDTRNTDPGIGSVAAGVTYTIHAVALTGTGPFGLSDFGAVVAEPESFGMETVLGPAA